MARGAYGKAGGGGELIARRWGYVCRFPFFRVEGWREAERREASGGGKLVQARRQWNPILVS